LDGGSNSVSRWSQDYIVDHLSLYNVEWIEVFFKKKNGGKHLWCTQPDPLLQHVTTRMPQWISNSIYVPLQGKIRIWCMMSRIRLKLSIYSSSIYHKEISWGFSWEHENRYSLHPILNIILTSWEVKHTQLWYNIYKKILMFMVLI